MPLVTGYGEPSSLADVLRHIKDVFEASADATPVMVGGHYLEDFGAGSAPRVLFIPNPGDNKGSVGPPIYLGDAASIVNTCNVLARAPEGGDDLSRFDIVNKLTKKLIDVIKTAAPGRIEWGEYYDNSPTKVDAYGADIAFSFTYTEGVRHTPERWNLPPAESDSSPKFSALSPGATPATVEAVNPTTDPKE